MKSSITLPVLAFLAACGGDKEEETFTPAEGNWSYDGSEYANDGCNLQSNPIYSTDVLDAIVFSLANTSETVMTLTSDAGANFECTRDGTSATCEDSIVTEVNTYNDSDGNQVVDENGDPVDPDAVATLAYVATITFTDAETASYTASLDGTCEGADCGVVLTSLGIEEAPCSSELSGDILYQATE